MKKIIAVLVVFILSFGLVSCGEPSPTDQVDAFLQAIKTQDAESLKTLYAGGDFSILEDTESDDEKFDKLFEEKLMPKLLDFDYTLSNEKIKDDKATVDVAFTTYNMGNAITSFMTNYFTQAFTMALSGSSNEQLESLAVTLLTTEINKLDSKDYKQTVTISLSKKDDTWIIDGFEENGDFYNAITGGIIEAGKNLEDAYDFDE